MARTNIESECTGNVWKISAKVGDKVEVDDVVLILESMKMEIPLEAPCAGTIVEILVAENDAVEEDQLVAVIETD
ncbi:MAG: acetyl-CoA carboxylase biotin carboxyl carrier protein subunit [Pseudomonadales bacterium]|nr:acetyl-CoA carboxylase biotin carboxyl carrier protein subunit [Pseudomonadales bacterium]